MSTILGKILEQKAKEVAERRELYPVKLLEKSLYFSSAPVSLRSYLRRADLSGIIAEIKRRSPSKGDINRHISVESLSLGYMQAGASALSVLTDEKFFGGSLDDLRTARRFNFCPILRKDFVIDEYQVIEAKSAGADAVLLIAAALSPASTRELGALAQSLGMEVLLEVHSEAELKTHVCPEASLIGVNNRDLTDFTVDVSLSERLAPMIPAEFGKVTESGISDAATMLRLKSAGFEGFLIGEAFMRHSQPQAACRKLVSELQPGERA
jgi:indole-3-glycerol phosphate synthase